MGILSCRCFLLSLVIIMLFPLQAPAATPVITCHCFTDRSYDPARPTGADPYFLATTQNSFFAAALGVDKKTIVIKKQKGISSDDLWIAYWIAARSGADPESLLQERKGKGSWRQIVKARSISSKSLGVRVADALKTNAADTLLAQEVVDDLLLRFRFHGEAELPALRKAGAGNQELIISGLLAAKTRQPAIQLYREVKSGSSSWGALLQRATIDPSEIQAVVALLLKTSEGSRPK